MIIEIMLMLIAVGVGLIFVVWTNMHKRKEDAMERKEVEDSTGKLKQELERTASEIIGRMENHVTHLEKIIDESERNSTQLEGRVTELKKLIKKSEGHTGEMRDLLARLDDAGVEVDSMQRKMDVVERKINLAITTPMPQQLSPLTIQQPVAPLPVQQPMNPLTATPVPTMMNNLPPVNQTPSNQLPPLPQTSSPLDSIGSITIPQMVRSADSKPTDENLPPQQSEFDKILEKSISTPPEQSTTVKSAPVKKKQTDKLVETVNTSIGEETRKTLSEISAIIAKSEQKKTAEETSTQPRKKGKKSKRAVQNVRQAALDAIREAEELSANNTINDEEPPEISSTGEKLLPPRRDLKLETTDAGAIKEMLLSGMSVENISRKTGLGRGAIELVQEITRRRLAQK
ncbi:MAG: hypothetical protein K6G55_06040 [Selenomonadaceae bacterium]|nr:hypothetical protein [Selenomonadaceae bacterium]